jgi:DNA-binding beta-propeller fold protein YncE
MRNRPSVIGGIAGTSRRMLTRGAAKLWSWLSRGLPGPRAVPVLAAAGCAAACLAGTSAAAAGTAAAGTMAAGTVPTAPGSDSVMPGPAAGRLTPPGMARAQIAGARLTTARDLAARPPNAFAVPGGPIALASNPRDKTLYVVTLGRTISLVSTARCNRLVRSGCKVAASVPGRPGFQFVAVDPSTDTIYALFGGTTGAGHTVQVINGARCNAGNASDCHAVATVQVGRFPIGAALDRAAGTLYVSDNYSGTVSMINTSRCNARRTVGCARRPAVARVGKGPNISAVDQATHTLYVPNDGPGGSSGNIGSGGTTVSMIDTTTCNAMLQSGCREPAPAATVPDTPFGVTIAARTVYAWNTGSDAVPSDTASLINVATCNATRHTSCHRAQPTATVGAGPGPGASNPRTRTVYAVNTGDDTVSALSTAACNARRHTSCAPAAPTLTADGQPVFVLADAATDTVYVANVVDSTVSVLSGAACNATDQRGCRRLAPSVPQHEYLMSADPATNTIYAGNLSQPRIDVINGATCHARQLAGCAPVAEIPMTSSQANIGSIDHATHTLYASNPLSDTVAVISTATCNAENTTGCAAHPPTVKIGRFPNAPAVNTATQTMYVSYGSTANRIAVVNAATCNATDTSGCGQTPAVVRAGQGTFVLAVSAATDTVYGPNASSDTVAVINGATCNGTDHSGCGHLAATAKAGSGPFGVAVNDRTHTVYVTNNAGGDSPGTVSVINSATCNGTMTMGCSGPFRTMATGRSPLLAAVDARTGTVYVTDFASAAVTILNGSRCNASVTSGCGKAGHEQPVGSQPLGLAINPRTRAVYVSLIFQPGSLSIFGATHH